MEFKNRDLMKPHYSGHICQSPGSSLYWDSTRVGLKYENALSFQARGAYNAEMQQVLQVNHEILLS